jgi:hypothetical protein
VDGGSHGGNSVERDATKSCYKRRMRRRPPESASARESDAAHWSSDVRPTRVAGQTVVARLAAIGPNGDPWISRPGGKGKPERARATVALGPAFVGREVLVCFAGTARTPVVVGLIVQPGDVPIDAEAPAVDLWLDRQRIVLNARQEVVLSCGKATIRLTADGKVVVQGADIVSSAGRVNRIRGGAVKIN